MTARPRRLLLLAEGYSDDPHHGKTARGVLAYGRDPVVAVLDASRRGERLGDVPIVGSVAEALAVGGEEPPTVALVGVATAGGRIPDAWRPVLADALAAGLDLEAGMHTFFADDPELAALAHASGAQVRDLRRPPDGLGVPTGANLALPDGTTVVLTVGSDCAIGKMTVALEADREAARRLGPGASVFVPTGQTGIAIAGWGISVDAVVADFVAGAAERLVVDGAARGSLLWVEGQGAILHPHYSAVTLGLYHGAAPSLLVLCHTAGVTHLDGLPDQAIPPLSRLVALYESLALPARPARVVAVSLNTSALDEEAAHAALAAATAETGLPAADPVRFAAAPIVDAVLAAR